MSVKIKPKDLLIETASRLFKARGYCAAGLNDIIAESGNPMAAFQSYVYSYPRCLAKAVIRWARRLALFLERNTPPANQSAWPAQPHFRIGNRFTLRDFFKLATAKNKPQV